MSGHDEVVVPRDEEVDIADAQDLVDAFLAEDDAQLIAFSVLGAGADFGLILLHPDFTRLQRLHRELMRTDLGDLLAAPMLDAEGTVEDAVIAGKRRGHGLHHRRPVAVDAHRLSHAQHVVVAVSVLRHPERAFQALQQRAARVVHRQRLAGLHAHLRVAGLEFHGWSSDNER